MPHYLFSKSIIHDLVEKIDRHLLDMYSMKGKIILGDMRITRSRAKKRITGEAVCVPKHRKLKICKEIIELFYADAVDFKDMRMRTSGPEHLIHVDDYALIQEAFEYIKSKYMSTANLLDVAAGVGSRVYQLLEYCTAYFSFDSDERMVNEFNYGILPDIQSNYPHQQIKEMLHASIDEIDAGNFNCIFIHNFLCHLSDEDAVKFLIFIKGCLQYIPANNHTDD